MIVHKLDTRGEAAITYEGTLAGRFADGVRIDARWERPALSLGYTTFEPGDRFVEWYFTDRWYNVFEIASADGALKGWYCNVTEPAQIAAEDISCRDLLLDLWVSPDGTWLVLDEDEFAADTTLDSHTRALARAGLDALLTLVRDRQPPFDRLPLS
jgi:predicted RNA-binding protein associated with RNAse of E/G family